MLFKERERENGGKREKNTPTFAVLFFFEKEGKREKNRHSVITTFRNNMTHYNSVVITLKSFYPVEALRQK